MLEYLRVVAIGLVAGALVYVAAALVRSWKAFFYGLGVDTVELQKHPGLHQAAKNLRKFFPFNGRLFGAFVKKLERYVAADCADADAYYEIKQYVEDHCPSFLKKKKKGLNFVRSKWIAAQKSFIDALNASFNTQ